MESNGTDLAAWWGAIVATIVLLWDIYKAITKKPELFFHSSFSMQFGGNRAHELEVEICNAGNKAITIKEVYLKPGRAAFYHNLEGEPSQIPGGIQLAASTIERFSLPYKLDQDEVWVGKFNAKNIRFLDEIKTVFITAVGGRGKKFRHEVTIPDDWKKSL
jgi:hypothetical protein